MLMGIRIYLSHECKIILEIRLRIGEGIVKKLTFYFSYIHDYVM